MKIQKRRPECKTIEDVVLANVGMTKEEFLIPKAKYHIDGIEESTSLLNVAGYHNEKITIVGDYDADGICASSILSLVFREKGWEHTVRLPRRFSEGYGLSETIIDEIDSGLLITVDNGIAASEEIKKAKENNANGACGKNRSNGAGNFKVGKKRWLPGYYSTCSIGKSI